jgi:hypothetical protein
MALPALTFQIAFDSDPTDPTFTWTTVPGSMALTYNRGQQNEYGRTETGESVVQVGDAASDLDPANVQTVNRVNDPATTDRAHWHDDGVFATGGGSLAPSTDRALFGPTSMKGVCGSSPNPYVYPDVIVVQAGETLTLSLYVWANTATNFQWSTSFWNLAESAQLDAQTGPVIPVPANTWTRVSQTVTVTNALGVHMYPALIAIGKSAGQVMYFNGGQCELGTTPTPYIDGDQVGCRWTGAPKGQSFRGSRYATGVRRMRPMRAFITIGGVDYPLFQHFIERLPRTRSVGKSWTERSVTGVDAFAWFALSGIKGRSYAGESTGTRWGHVLDDVAWPAVRRDIDTGNSTLDPATFDDNATTKALEHLLDAAENENGFGFMDATGNARLIERHAAIKDTTTVATFADGRSFDTGLYPSAVKYQGLQPESTDIVNDYSGQRAGGPVMSASDAASIDAYGPRSSERTFLIDSDQEVQSALEWRLSQTKEPAERVDALTVMPGLDLAAWVIVLGLEVGDRILVVEWPPGFPAPVETEYLVRHLEGELPLALEESTFTFQLTPAGTDAWFVLDDASAGRVDFNKLAY